MKTFAILFNLLAAVVTLRAASNPVHPTQDKPFRLYVESYSSDQTSYTYEREDSYDDQGNYAPDYAGFLWWWYIENWEISQSWFDGSGGNGEQLDYVEGTDDYEGLVGSGTNYYNTPMTYNWPASSWPNVAVGTITYADGTTDTIGSPIILEHCDIGVPMVDLTDNALLPPDYANYTWLQMDCKTKGSRNADAVMKLQVGGKAKSQRQNLIAFNGSATQVVPVRDPFYHSPNQFVQNIPVPPQSVTVNGKALGSDGNLYVVMADGDEAVVTPTVTGMKYYTFGLTAGKYTPVIAARGNGINYDDISVTNPEFCVGQQLTFWMNWSPPNVTNANYWWHLPDKYVNEQTNYSSTCTTYVQNTDLLTNATTQCWYVNQPAGACSVREILQFSNGQSVNIGAAGNFTIYRPTATVDVEHPGAVSLDGSFYVQDAPVDFYGHVQSAYHGYANWTQIINRDLQEAFYVENPTYAQDWLDTYTFYSNQSSPEVGPGHDNNSIPLDDAPEVVIDVHVSNIDKFKTYLMFKPDGDGSIYVPLGRTDWGWNGDAFPGLLQDGGITAPQYTPTDEFPVWSNVYTSSEH